MSTPDGGNRIWHSRTLDEVARLDGHTFHIKPPAFNPDGEPGEGGP